MGDVPFVFQRKGQGDGIYVQQSAAAVTIHQVLRELVSAFRGKTTPRERTPTSWQKGKLQRTPTLPPPRDSSSSHQACFPSCPWFEEICQLARVHRQTPRQQSSGNPLAQYMSRTTGTLLVVCIWFYRYLYIICVVVFLIVCCVQYYFLLSGPFGQT